MHASQINGANLLALYNLILKVIVVVGNGMSVRIRSRIEIIDTRVPAVHITEHVLLAALQTVLKALGVGLQLLAVAAIS